MPNACLFTLLALLTMAAPAASAQQQAPASLSGTLADPSGAVLPGVELRLTDSMFGLVCRASPTAADRSRFLN